MSCETCNHRNGNTCGLTKRPLPKSRFCCHHNTGLLTTPIVLTKEQVSQLQIGGEVKLTTLLDEFDVPYQLNGTAVVVNPGDFPPPQTYGIGAEHEDLIDEDGEKSGATDILQWHFDW